jgi:acyl-CoA synthetase (AMP-forming)/AMP-acid ligase II
MRRDACHMTERSHLQLCHTLCCEEDPVVVTPSHFQSLSSSELRCIAHTLTHQAEHTPDATAILAHGRPPLSDSRIHRHISDMGKTLRTIGVGRNERVALVLPDDSELAGAFLAVAASATCAPLHPAYSADEFATYLADLRANAVMVQA